MIPARYLFTLLACVGNMVNLFGRDSLRIGILAIREEASLCQASLSANQTAPSCGSIQWSDSNMAHVLGAFNYGMILTMVCGGPLSDMLGGKYLLLMVTLVSSLCTILIPVLADSSLPGLITCQVVYGLSGGLVVPALSCMIARWEPRSQRGRLATIIYTGSQFSAVFTALFTGYITYSYNWRLVFYILGCVPLLWVIPWLLLISDNPADSKLISAEEKDLLMRETSTSELRPRIRDIPFSNILSSRAVWGIIFANIGCSWATMHTSLLLPQFLHQVLLLPIHHNSIISSLPYIGCCLVGLLASCFYTWMTTTMGVAHTAARKICSSICLWGFAGLTLTVPLISQDTVLVTIACTGAYSLMGFNLVGAWSNPLDIAPNYVGTIMGISGLFCYLTGALVPNTLGLASALVSPDQVWTVLFLLVVGVTIISNMLFLLLGTAELQEWNSVGSSDSRESLHQCEDKAGHSLLGFESQKHRMV
eukprot:GFUD01013826.1.p1 GENE.GFUD01013826.1~~GFUD01013826.1.p1  ORF type:complete len:478 (-),score=134.62 GFUD01013826.1:105-1538(-)